MTRNAIVGLSVVLGLALLLFVTLGRPLPLIGVTLAYRFK